MARRKLVNIDEKILRETIKLGAQNGINNIPARKVAKNCGITDATVFEHFRNKRNLILQAKNFIEKEILSIQPSIKMTMEEYEPTVREAWESCFEYFVSHPDETKFYDNYRHSEHYTPSISGEKDGLVRKLYEFMRSLNPQLRHQGDFAYKIIWAHTVETTINVALQIINGKLEKTPAATDFVYDLIFGGIIGNK